MKGEPLRVPPHHTAAEQSVLGALLLDNNALDRVVDLIGPEDFYAQEHGIIFRHIVREVEAGRPADVVTVAAAIAASPDATKTRGLPYLGELARETPSAHNVRRYAEVVRDTAALRRLIRICDETSVAAYNHGPSLAVGDLLEQAQHQLAQLADRRAGVRSGSLTLSDALSAAMERVDYLYNRDRRDGDVAGVATGFVDLDRMTAGLEPGDLVILAGRPSQGKTALALNIAEHVARTGQGAVAMFSMEMSGTQLAARMLSASGRIDHHLLRTGDLGDEEWSRAATAIGKLHSLPIEIDETAALTPRELRRRARGFHRKHGGLGLVVVDYLQLMRGTRTDENRANEVAEISRAMKALARELHVPVMALSQLNRQLEGRVNKRPQLADLRESGAIEQDADLVMAIYRDEVYHPDSDARGTAEVLVLKARHGATGMVRLTFDASRVRFDNFAGSLDEMTRGGKVRTFSRRRSGFDGKAAASGEGPE